MRKRSHMTQCFKNSTLTLCLPVSSAGNLGKQFGPRSGPTNHLASSGSKLFDILMVFLNEFFQKVNFEKIYPVCKVNCVGCLRML